MDYGFQNFKNWLRTDNLENISSKRDEYTMKYLTKLAIMNLMHPFQTFMLGQKIFATKMAAKYKIPLVFFGENEAEHGNPIADNTSSLRDKSYHSFDNLDEIFLAGISIAELMSKYDVRLSDLMSFLPPKLEELEKITKEFEETPPTRGRRVHKSQRDAISHQGR